MGAIGDDAATGHAHPANQAGGATDVRDHLREDHQQALAELQALHMETNADRAQARLRESRQRWIIHSLAEETVVYRVLEAAGDAQPARAGDDAPPHADERFIEHELAGALFDRLIVTPPGSREWRARLTVVSELISRHIQTEHGDLFARLAESFDRDELHEMGRRFQMASQKLTLLENAKAA